MIFPKTADERPYPEHIEEASIHTCSPGGIRRDRLVDDGTEAEVGGEGGHRHAGVIGAPRL